MSLQERRREGRYGKVQVAISRYSLAGLGVKGETRMKGVNIVKGGGHAPPF
jgi:hypothetical protein